MRGSFGLRGARTGGREQQNTTASDGEEPIHGYAPGPKGSDTYITCSCIIS